MRLFISHKFYKKIKIYKDQKYRSVIGVEHK